MSVEVKIGITDSPRELTVATSLTSDEAFATAEAALSGKEQRLLLVDEKGSRILVPITKIAYIEIGTSENRRVGFGS